MWLKDKRYEAYSNFIATTVVINKYVEEVMAIPHPHNAPRNIPKVEKLGECLGALFLIGSVEVNANAVDMHILYGELELLLYAMRGINRKNDRAKDLETAIKNIQEKIALCRGYTITAMQRDLAKNTSAKGGEKN